MYWKLTASMLVVQLSCCDCVEINVSRGNVPSLPPELEPMSRKSVSGPNGQVFECPPA
jgi:hypothetical protein